MTKSVPYLGAITGCIQKLIEIRKSMKNNKERAEALLNSIWDVSRVLAVGLQPMDAQSQSTAANLLKDDLQRYQIFQNKRVPGRVQCLTSDRSFAGAGCMDAKLLAKWLRPSVHVADSQRNAANARHPKTGLWLLERPEFREWIYAPGSFLWLHGMCSLSPSSSSTIIDTIHARAEHYAYFYFDTNSSEQGLPTSALGIVGE
ncbi:hypothetical protein B0H13DRAFT_1862945 [Mycena leptocephala]|nr:hypothetical protein B0H13DRAFT_1862945 [Mycena leptocephala]